MPNLLPTRFAPECIREFELAAQERYADAIVLSDEDRRSGAIYLFGYVVEMTLKAAFLRLAGHADDAITVATLWGCVGQKPASMAKLLGLPGATNLHDIVAWVDLIVAFRTDRGLVYPEPEFAATLTDHVSGVAERWTETIRYHKNVAYVHELNRVRTACRWVVENRTRI